MNSVIDPAPSFQAPKPTQLGLAGSILVGEQRTANSVTQVLGCHLHGVNLETQALSRDGQT